MSSHVNFTTHKGFERLENFSGKIEEYRKDKIDSAKEQVGFIGKNFLGRKITVLELCSGNSRTLFALDKAGILESGYGIEISRTRHEFAQLWKNEWGFERVENINGNVIDFDLEKMENYDLCICMDMAFHYFEPIKKGNALKILKRVNKKIKKGGKIILELDGFKRITDRIIDGNVKLWEEFPYPDPWRYSLWDCYYEAKYRLLTLKKIFIKRGESGFSKTAMVLQTYKKDDISMLLKRAGFKKIELFSGWDGRNFKDDASSYIVSGVK